MDDLSLALGEHGVNVNKPDYCKASRLSLSSSMLTARSIMSKREVEIQVISVVHISHITIFTSHHVIPIMYHRSRTI